MLYSQEKTHCSMKMCEGLLKIDIFMKLNLSKRQTKVQQLNEKLSYIGACTTTSTFLSIPIYERQSYRPDLYEWQVCYLYEIQSVTNMKDKYSPMKEKGSPIWKT